MNTNDTDDVTLDITDKDGHVLPIGGFTVPGEDGHGGMMQFDEPVHGPCKASLSGIGSTATIYYREVY